MYFCDFTSGELKCETAADNFLMANGITTNKDYSLIFVNDATGKSIRVLERNKESNKLTFKKEIPIIEFTDNVKYDDLTGNIYGGAMTNMGALMQHIYDLHIVQGERFPDIEDGKYPDITSGALELKYNEEDNTHKTRTIVNSPKLIGVSNVLRMHNVVVMGTWGPEGLLVCPIDEKIPFDNWIAQLNTRGVYDAFRFGLDYIYGIQAY